MHLFYTPDIIQDTYTLSEDESKHCIRVLRLTIGAKIVLIDGKGGWYDAVISNDDVRRCSVNIVNKKKEFGKCNLDLHIAIAPTKNMDRLELFVEKATELGISEISTIDCQNIKRTVVKTERLDKVAISAIKQSMKAYLPRINEMVEFEKFINLNKEYKGQRFIAHCYEAENKIHLKNVYKKGENALILIGPEGDFSKDEVKFALDNGFQEINLGSSRLRTETAAIYACTAINILNEI